MKKIVIKNNQINWVCLKDKCPKNCCGPFKANKSQKSLWQIKESLIPLTLDDYRTMIKNNLKKYLIRKKDGGWYIKTTKDGSCPFLKNNQCSIYSNRPKSCKAYPFFFSKYCGLYADLTCPGWGKGWTKMTKIKAMVRELVKLYQYQTKKAVDYFQ